MFYKINEIIQKTPIDKQALIDLVPVLGELDKLEFYNPAHIYGVLDHSVKSAELVNDELLRFALIFHDVGKLKTARQEPHRTEPDKYVTKFPNHETHSVKIVNELFEEEIEPETLNILLKLIEYHDTPLIQDGDEEVMTTLAKQYGSKFVGDLLKIQKADMSTHSTKYSDKMVDKLDCINKIYQKKHRIN